MGYLDDEGRIDEKGRSIPPAGLSVLKEARWWLAHPADLNIACMVKLIPPDIWDAIEIQAKDNTLAAKLVQNSHGLEIEERERLIELLTGGETSISLPPKGRKPKYRRNLKIAKGITGIDDSKTRNHQARELALEPLVDGKKAGHKYGTEKNNISKLLKEVKKLSSKWDIEKIEALLEKYPEFKPTERELDFIIDIAKLADSEQGE